MTKFKTNFALLLELSGLSGSDFCRLAGASRSQLAMWRSGSRKLTIGSHWPTDIADVFLTERLPFLAPMLSDIYPFGLLEGDALKDQLIRWLVDEAQYRDSYAKKRMELYVKYLAHNMSGQEANEILTPGGEQLSATIVHGYYETQQAIAGAVEYIGTLKEPEQFTFVCPEGIDIITKNESYRNAIMEILMHTLKKGHTLNVVLRTNFKMSDVTTFVGPWFLAHLMGYIKSWYYDDFRQVETDGTILLVKGVMALHITGDDYRCETFTDEKTLARLEKVCSSYIRRSKQRFFYNFFEQPGDMLKGLRPTDERQSYFFQRLPHFSIGGETLLDKLALDDTEKKYVLEQFGLGFLSPDSYDKASAVNHMFCMTDLENMLDKPRHLHQALTKITGRRVYMDTQLLVDQLCEIRKLLDNCRNYTACFLSGDIFDRIGIEIGVWTEVAGFGWIAGKQSAVTTYFINTIALDGFCATVWSRIPKIARSRTAAKHALSKLLNRAGKMGYVVK